MATESENIKEFIIEEKLKQAKSAFSVEQVMDLTSLSTKSKVVTFWLSLAIPGGGYAYLNLYGKFFAIFLTCFCLFVLAIVSLCHKAYSECAFFFLLDICIHLFSVPLAIAKVDSVKNEAKYHLSEYYKSVRQKEATK